MSQENARAKGIRTVDADGTLAANSDARLATQKAIVTYVAAQMYTDERVDDRVAALLVAGSNITLTYNDPANTLTIAASGGGGVSIGDAIGSGTANYVLFIDGAGKLAQSSHFQFDTTNGLTLTDGTRTAVFANGSVAGSFLSGSLAVTLCTSGYAGGFADGTHGVTLADGTYAVNAYAGTIYVAGTSGNTYRWGANISAPGTQTLLSLPLNVYGQGTISDLLGDPDAWVLININGTDYKLPAYLP